MRQNNAALEMKPVEPILGWSRRWVGFRVTAASLLAVIAISPGAASSHAAPSEEPRCTRNFSIAVISDTQYYADYTKQRAEGFPFDAARIMEGQMREIERRLPRNGGDVAFVTALGDIWQNPSVPGIDPRHGAMGLVEAPHPAGRPKRDINYRQVEEVEIPAAVRAYRILDGQVPFAVVPGNHDYDSYWFVPQGQDKGLWRTEKTTVNAHFGGLDSFTRAFGDQSSFFKGKDWYVGYFNRGANSAQTFAAGGYRFLHIGLEMAPGNDVLAWANATIAAYPDLPVIVTTHDFLDAQGQRKPWPNVRPTDVDASHNSAEDIWNKLIRKNANIFLVLSGHHYGEALRTDRNDAGEKVHQMLSDYQERRQTIDAVADPAISPWGMGDGWMRFIAFDFSQAKPILRVRTYSTYYHAYSTDLPRYAAWYKPRERPDLSDADFLSLGNFEIGLDDFYGRFGRGAMAPGVCDDVRR